MFRNKNTRRQIIFVGMSMLMVLIIGQVAGRLVGTDTSGWQVFEFTNDALPDNVTFEIGGAEQTITATLTNTGDAEIAVSAEFVLLRLTDEIEDEWRVFPFSAYVGFGQAETILPQGYSAVFSLSEEMLAVELFRGVYKIATTIRRDDTILQVWSEPFSS